MDLFGDTDFVLIAVLLLMAVWGCAAVAMDQGLSDCHLEASAAAPLSGQSHRDTG
jgi:hypothetical protein